jgi:hypothetical protein
MAPEQFDNVRARLARAFGEHCRMVVLVVVVNRYLLQGAAKIGPLDLHLLDSLLQFLDTGGRLSRHGMTSSDFKKRDQRERFWQFNSA